MGGCCAKDGDAKMAGKFGQECLKAHNDYRQKHGSPALKYNKEIASIAQSWADQLAQTGSFQHSTNRKYKGDKMGENIAMKWSSGNEEYNGFQATEQWYSEVKKYNFNRHGGAGTGHFTQVVWRDSKELGIGCAQARDGKWLVVANYYPAGNFMGRNAENVFPTGTKVSAGSSKPASSGSGGGGGFSSSPFGSRNDSPSGGTTNTRTVTTREFNDGGDFGNFGDFGRGFGSGFPSSSSGGYSKTVITETKIGPDGKKTTVTREVVNEGGNGGGGASNSRFDDFESRFNNRFDDMRMGNGSGSPFTTTSHTTRAIDDSRGKEPKKQNMKDFIDEVVKSHNKYRKSHGRVGDLKHNKEQSTLAQQWADHLAATSKLGHSNHSFKGKPLGENVATKWSSAGADYAGDEVTKQWYDEISKYDYNSANFTSGTGHFTQVVWKGSKEIGIGKAFGRDGRVFVVCNYFPAGNMMGDFRENVFPPK